MKKPAGYPDWKLERFLLDELPEAQQREIQEQLEESKALRARLDELRASNARILERYPTGEMAAEIRGRLDDDTSKRGRPPAHPSARHWSAFGAVAAVLAVALGILLWPERPHSPGDAQPEDMETSEERVRIKGATPQVQVFRKTEQGAEVLDEEAVAGEGDLVQLGYAAAGKTHGVIVSIDGRGVVTLHHPSRRTGSARLKGAKELLDHAYQLDDAPRFERFFFVTGDREIEVERVVEAAEQLAASVDRAREDPLLFDEEYDQTSFLLEKDSDE